MTSTFHLREINPESEAEIDLVARRMQATLVEVEGEEMGLSLHSVPWLRDRVRWHLNPDEVQGRVVVAVNAQGEIIGHTLMRRELGAGEGENGPYGLVSTTYVMPEARRLGVADKLLDTAEEWFRSLALASGATWTSSTNVKLIRLYAKHGYVQVLAAPHDSTGSPMVKLEKRYLK